MSGNLFDLIRGRMPAADKTLIEMAAGERISYGEMLARSGRLAHALVRRGVKPGDRVAVQVEKTPENLLLFLASMRAGAVYLPLNTAYTIAELDYFIGDAEPTLVVCDPAKRE
ncbi:MAG: AMP-binding protein, partial [Rhodoplanes sp.]